jgi:hypothetical protein
MSRFSLSVVAFIATTFKLDKDFRDDKEVYATRHATDRDYRVA